MADDQFQLGSGNWWDSSRNRFEINHGTTPAASISTTLNAIASFGWPADMDSATPSGGGSVDQSSLGGGGAGGALGNPNLQMMELGLSSDWNQAFIRGEKADHGSYRCLLQEDLSSSSSSFQPPESGGAAAVSQEHWRQKLYSGASSEVDSAAAYGLLLAENQPEQQHPNYQNRPVAYPYGVYGGGAAELTHSWNKYPSFLRTSPPKQPPSADSSSSSHLHFTNNTPFWNASAMTEARSSFFPALQNQIPSPSASSFDEKLKLNRSETRDSSSSSTKKNAAETSNKRARSENPSPLPAFKVRKEKMGDRITALQQLVSPFGKTDTASVLSEAIEYIKFLHEQISVLSTPYMKNGDPQHHQHQNSEKLKDPEGPRQDLRSRGLCLVPVSSTFPVTHETTVDFWTPTFGGTFR